MFSSHTKCSFLFSFYFFCIWYFLYLHFKISFPRLPSRSPLFHSISPCLYEGTLPPTHSHFPSLAFPYTGTLNPLRPKGHSSHWCPTRPSSATYAAGAMGPSMCTLWLVVQSLGASGSLARWHCCSFHGAANPSALSVPSPTPVLVTCSVSCVDDTAFTHPKTFVENPTFV